MPRYCDECQAEAAWISPHDGRPGRWVHLGDGEPLVEDADGNLHHNDA